MPDPACLLESAQPVNATTNAQATTHPSRGLDDRTRNAVDLKTDMALDTKKDLASLVQAWLGIIIVQKARNPAETACRDRMNPIQTTHKALIHGRDRLWAAKAKIADPSALEHTKDFL